MENSDLQCQKTLFWAKKGLIYSMLDHCALCEFPCQIPTSAYLIFLMWHILSCSRRIYNFDTNVSINDISFKQLRGTVLSLSEEDALKMSLRAVKKNTESFLY